MSLKFCMRFIFLFLSLLNLAVAYSQKTSPADFVNPFIGTGGHGHTFPGATMPFGMVQLSPDTRIDGSWDGCGGYHYSDSIIYGFSHTHLSGTGISDYGDIMLMPLPHKTVVNPKEYSSKFSHKNETAKAGYYSVKLDNGNILAELSSSTRAGFHRYTFSAKSERWLLLDLNHRDKLLAGNIEKVGPNAIQGYRRSEAWARDQVVYFYMEFSEPIEDFQLTNTSASLTGQATPQLTQNVFLKFKSGKTPLLVKTGISAVDVEGARKNLQAEISHWNFEQTRQEATTAWNKELSKIEVKGGTTDQTTTFYTALYHCMTQPNIYNDVDGRYRGRDFSIHLAEGYNYYTVFSLWDTFRGLHPLLSLIDEKRTVDFINTFIDQYQQGGRLPVWELSANETECMIGYHAVPVIADAMMKGLEGFNYDTAYLASRHSAMLDHFGLKAYKSKGFLEVDDEHESVSKTLEYAYDDWCIAQMAGRTGNLNDYQLFTNRSYSWVNMFDARSGHMRPRINGGWLTPFDARQVNNHFTEANSWQYSFFAPHHIPELVKAYGGIKRFEKKLDELFTTSSATTGREQADITGLIGQYAQGNEPSHHMAYLYSLIGAAPKTQKQVRFIMDNFYKNAPDGLIGNEDCGQMSAWYVWGAMGMYPVCPGKSYYAIGTPLFPEVVIHHENGKTFTIKANQPDSSNFYIQKALLGDRELQAPVVQHREITTGGTLQYTLGKLPAENWKLKKDSTALEGEWKFQPAPLIMAAKQVFEDSMAVKVESPGSYELQLAGKTLTLNRDTTFYISANSTITATNLLKTERGQSSTANYYKRPNKWKVNLISTYNPQYDAGGDEGIIDGLKGDENWRKGRWQGFQEQDFEVIIDMLKVREINEVNLGFLQDTRSWILMPTQVVVETSFDGQSWYAHGIAATAVRPDDYASQREELTIKAYAKARYLKVKAKNFGNLPNWHQGAGYPAFIFVDEIGVR